MPQFCVDKRLNERRDEVLAVAEALQRVPAIRCSVIRLEPYGNGQLVLVIQRGDRNELGDRTQIVLSSPAHLVEQLEFKPGDHAIAVDMPAHARFGDGTRVEVLHTSPLAEAGTWAVRPAGDRDLSRAGFVYEEQLQRIRRE